VCFHLRPEDADHANSDDEEGYSQEEVDRRPRVERQISERRGQQAFRDALMRRYGNCCLVTGCKVVAVLEAAHIKPYRGLNDNHVKNGLLLRADIHTLFDLDLLGIEPDSMCVELHPSIAEEYGALAGKALRSQSDRGPSREALRQRYEQFQARSHRSA
jgi:predicted restriction endonuclease